jgi:hypothetical protein
LRLMGIAHIKSLTLKKCSLLVFATAYKDTKIKKSSPFCGPLFRRVIPNICKERLFFSHDKLS